MEEENIEQEDQEQKNMEQKTLVRSRKRSAKPKPNGKEKR